MGRGLGSLCVHSQSLSGWVAYIHVVCAAPHVSSTCVFAEVVCNTYNCV